MGDVQRWVGTTAIDACRHPEHNPPSMMVYESGIWEHTCPGCRRVTTFVVNKPFLLA